MTLLNILIGILGGIASGFFGIGGAVILVPLLVYLFKFSQHYAQGTALAALLLPVGILAVVRYFKAGSVNIKVALLISVGFVIGGFIGAFLAHLLPNLILKRLFGVMLLCISIYMLLIPGWSSDKSAHYLLLFLKVKIIIIMRYICISRIYISWMEQDAGKSM